jgi:hypothetical protein
MENGKINCITSMKNIIFKNKEELLAFTREAYLENEEGEVYRDSGEWEGSKFFRASDNNLYEIEYDSGSNPVERRKDGWVIRGEYEAHLVHIETRMIEEKYYRRANDAR